MIALRWPPAFHSSSSSSSVNPYYPPASTRYYRHSTPSNVAFSPRTRKNCNKFCRFSKNVKAASQTAAGHQQQQEKEEEEEEEEEEEDLKVLTAFQTRYNRILIVDSCKSRLLLLDSTHNVHSMINKTSKWTDSYWDEFSALPPVVPPGPIAIFGLGGGTAAHLMLDLWPSLQLEGWEIDQIVIDKSREYFGLLDLEKPTVDGGVLNIHIGDVFSEEAAIPGGYAGIIVDLFGDGKVLPQLQQASTWLKLSDKLMPGGRFMVNCASGEDTVPRENGVSRDNASSTDDSWKLNATIRALCEAFPGQVNWKMMPKGAGDNYLALTGPLPDLSAWSVSLPNELKSGVNQWRTCQH